jgi:hypothetical protein
MSLDNSFFKMDMCHKKKGHHFVAHATPYVEQMDEMYNDNAYTCQT